MGKSTKVLRGCLVAGGFFVLSSALLVGLYIAWSLYANDRAETAATALCTGIRVGDRIEPLLAKAETADPKPRVSTGTDEYHFTFQGAIFNGRGCEVTTAQGRVTAVHIVNFD